jgi:hypothetical protein
MCDDPASAETRSNTASVFGILRQLADTEPVLAVGVGINMCGLCEVAHEGPSPFPHAPRCPWIAARNIVGAPVEGVWRPALAAVTDRIEAATQPRSRWQQRTLAEQASLYPDVEVSTDGGRTWQLFDLATRAPLRVIVSDGQVHSDGRGNSYRMRATDGD